MPNLFDVDTSPQDSDWTDLTAMLQDIRAFMRDHPGHELIPADDPGTNAGRPRTPRLGFAAFRICTPEFSFENVRRLARGEPELEWDEQFKLWTITLPRLRLSVDRERDASLYDLLRTSKGRQNLCQSLKSVSETR